MRIKASKKKKKSDKLATLFWSSLNRAKLRIILYKTGKKKRKRKNMGNKSSGENIIIVLEIISK